MADPTNEIEMPAEYVGQGADTGASQWNDVVEQPQGDIEMPAEYVGRTPQGTGSASVAYKGLTPSGATAADKGVSAVDRSVDAYAKQQYERLGQQEGVLNADVANERTANDAKAATENEYYGKMAEAAAKQQALNKEYARQEQENAMVAKAQGADFVANLQQQLAAVRAMTVNPIGPIAEMSTAQMGGLSLANFAQGFLAARYGIKIDVTGQVDQWINQSIHEQERQIQQAQQGIQDQVSLWQIAKQNSKDDWEARQRYRAYTLESMKASNEALGFRFNSQLANANTAAVNAKLDQQLHQTQFAMRDRTEGKILEYKKFQSDEAYKQGMLHIEMLKAQAAINKQPKPAEDVRYYKDPFTGDVVGQLTNKTLGSEKRDEAVTKAISESAVLKQNIDTAEKALAEAGKASPAGMSLWARTDAKAREAQAAVQKVAYTYLHGISGAQYTEKEVEAALKQFPFESYYQSGNNAMTRLNFVHDAMTKLRSAVETNTEPVPGMKAAGDDNPRGIAPQEWATWKVNQVEAGRNPAQATVASTVIPKTEQLARPETEPTGMPTAINQAVQHVMNAQAENESPGISTKGKDFNVPASDSWSLFVRAHNAKIGAPDIDVKNMPAWAVNMDHLAVGVVRPSDLKAAGEGLHDKELAKIVSGLDDRTVKYDSAAALQRLAADKNPALSNYAQFLLDRIESKTGR